MHVRRNVEFDSDLQTNFEDFQVFLCLQFYEKIPYGFCKNFVELLAPPAAAPAAELILDYSCKTPAALWIPEWSCKTPARVLKWSWKTPVAQWILECSCKAPARVLKWSCKAPARVLEGPDDPARIIIVAEAPPQFLIPFQWIAVGHRVSPDRSSALWCNSGNSVPHFDDVWIGGNLFSLPAEIPLPKNVQKFTKNSKNSNLTNFQSSNFKRK